jgi:ATP-binding cassette subfamily B protein
LLAKDGAYAAMWNRQREAAAAREKLSQVENDPAVNPDVERAVPTLVPGAG